MLQIKTVVDDIFYLPERAHRTDAGADLRSVDTVYLLKDTRTIIKTGVKVAIPEGFVGLLFPRSSLSKKNIIMTNSVGVIDSDYRGELMASLMYIGNQDGVCIEKDERIVQLVIVPIVLPEFTKVESLDETIRGEGGFGSSGTK